MTDFFDLVKTETPQEIRAAIRNGADIEARSETGLTPLMWAAGHNPNPDVEDSISPALERIKSLSESIYGKRQYGKDGL